MKAVSTQPVAANQLLIERMCDDLGHFRKACRQLPLTQRSYMKGRGLPEQANYSRCPSERESRNLKGVKHASGCHGHHLTPAFKL